MVFIAVGMKVAGDHRRAKRKREQEQNSREGEEIGLNQSSLAA